MRPTRFSILTLTLLLSLACNLLGAPASDPDQPAGGSPIATPGEGAGQPSEEETDQAPEQLEPPDIPADFWDLVQRNEELGLWSEGEGLVAGLEYLAGLAEEDSLFAPEGMVRAEASSLIWRARDYTVAGAEPAVRQRISQLLQTVAPDLETLEAYSQPAPASLGGGAPLTAPLPQTQCAKLAADGFPQGSAEVCWLYDELQHADGFARVYYPTSWGPSGGDKQLLLQAAVMAAEQSITTFGQYGALPSINLVFGLIDLPVKNGFVTGADAGLGGTLPEDACIITIYANAAEAKLEGFKQLMAHEIFHCFQWKHYSALMGVEAESDWWVEGSATYFSDLAYPKVGAEEPWLAHFTSHSRYASIVTMSYASYVFFEYLGSRADYGPAGVLALMGAMPPSGGAVAQGQALGQQPGMEAVWEAFALDFLDGKVIDADGQPMQPPLLFTESYALFENDTHDLAVTDFSLQRYRLAIGPGQGFHLHLSQADDGVLDWTHRPLEIGGWTALALDLPEGCDQFMAVVVRARGEVAGERKATLDVVVDTPLKGTCEQCIVGTWELNKPSFKAYMENLIDFGPGMTFSVIGQAGSARYTFGGEGGLELQFAPYSFAWRSLQSNQPLGNDILSENILTFSGQGSGSYIADGVSGLHASTDLSGVSTELVLHLNGEEIYKGPPFEESFISGGVPPTTTYTCQEDVLTITVMNGGHLLGTVSYDRVAQP